MIEDRDVSFRTKLRPASTRPNEVAMIYWHAQCLALVWGLRFNLIISAVAGLVAVRVERAF